ncbi:MAG: hypothetical protein IJ837_04080 [Clostridia bacterium]|nr:hypothetical protein [Clostridia bacterium]
MSKIREYFEKLTNQEQNEETFDIFNLYWYLDNKELKMAFEQKDENEKYVMRDCLTKEIIDKNSITAKFCSFNEQNNKVKINDITIKLGEVSSTIFPEKVNTLTDIGGVDFIDTICPKTFLPYNPQTIIYRDFDPAQKTFRVGYKDIKDIKICTPKSKLEGIINATNKKKEKVVKKETKEYLEKKCKTDARANSLQNELK